MRIDSGRVCSWMAPLVAACAALTILPGPARAEFQVGLQDTGFGSPANSFNAGLANRALQVVNGSVVRVAVHWAQVAPNGHTMPPGFVPSDPADPHYHWDSVDAAVRAAAAQHAGIILNILDAPRWAEGPNPPPFPNSSGIYQGAWDPDPGQLAQFARAAALRYDGGFPDPQNPGSMLPQVRYWEIWNEENIPVYLAVPSGGDLAGEYRALLDAGYSAVKGVSSGNVVVFGGLAPVSYVPPISMAPLQFAADVMCMHRVGSRYVANGSCPQPAEFDVFAIHPYSLAATPTKPAYMWGNVLVGDMPKVAALVAAADRLHTVLPHAANPIWVTEFAWFTNPPNNLVGDSDRAAARYVAYSLYAMWRAGVSLVVWQPVIDTSMTNPVGGGLFTSAGAPKRILSALAFPFVAGVRGRSGFGWGRVPLSRRVRVVIQRRSGSRWRKVATTHTGTGGIFYVHFSAHGNGLYRAVTVAGLKSLPYNSQPIPPKRTRSYPVGLT